MVQWPNGPALPLKLHFSGPEEIVGGIHAACCGIYYLHARLKFIDAKTGLQRDLRIKSQKHTFIYNIKESKHSSYLLLQFQKNHLLSTDQD